MSITDYVINLDGEPLSNRLRIRKALARHGQRYTFDTPSAESPGNTLELYLIYCDSPLQDGWITSFHTKGRTVLSIDQFVAKFTHVSHTRISR